MNHCVAYPAFVLVLVPSWSKAEVLDSSANGFTTKTTLSIQASPDAVYRAVLHIGDWWNSQHTFSGDAHNLSIEEKAGGCFCEKLPNNGSARHMQVVLLAPGKTIGLTGGLGPLQSIAATGSMQIQLSPAEGGTKLEVTYAVAGYLPAGMNTWAAPVGSVLAEQFTRLKNFIEHGDPAPK
jgi:uncharacterized protein YndB with AHSA1/START domain